MARAPLSDAEVQTRIAKLPGWSLVEGKLDRTFRFADFSEAFAFMARAALAAEKLDHHPNWSNVYSTVHVQLTTHDANGLTPLDFELAEAMNTFAA